MTRPVSCFQEKEKLERQTKDTVKELLAVKSTFQAAEEKNSKLQQQLTNKMGEIKKLHNEIQDKQDKISSNITFVWSVLPCHTDCNHNILEMKIVPQ